MCALIACKIKSQLCIPLRDLWIFLLRHFTEREDTHSKAPTNDLKLKNKRSCTSTSLFFLRFSFVFLCLFRCHSGMNGFGEIFVRRMNKFVGENLVWEFKRIEFLWMEKCSKFNFNFYTFHKFLNQKKKSRNFFKFLNKFITKTMECHEDSNLVDFLIFLSKVLAQQLVDYAKLFLTKSHTRFLLSHEKHATTKTLQWKILLIFIFFHVTKSPHCVSEFRETTEESDLCFCWKLLWKTLKKFTRARVINRATLNLIVSRGHVKCNLIKSEFEEWSREVFLRLN